MSLRSTATIIRVVVATIPFLLMCLGSGQINLKRSERGHQFILPIVAVFYCIPVMLFVDSIAVCLIQVVGTLVSVVSKIPLVGSNLSGWLSSIYETLSVGYGVQLLCNTVVMATFCAVKRVALPVIKKWWRKWQWLYRMTTGRFYETVRNRLVLKQQFAQMRLMFNAMYYAAVVLGCLDCVLALVFNDSTAFQFPFYPVFSIIVLGEISFFLNGWTADENSGGKSPHKDNGEVDFEALMQTLAGTFSDRVILKDEVPKAAVMAQEHDWEAELDEGNALDQIAGAYFSAMHKGGEPVNPDYVSAARKLLHHKSVLIYNPFYRDLTSYLLLPVFHELLNHQTCLVVCGRMSNESDIKEWLYDGIKSVTNLPKLWKISELNTLSMGTEIPDIGILGFRKLYDLDNLRVNREFFQKVGMVFLLEPSNLLGTGQIGLRSALQYCEGSGKKVTYCILDRNADGIVDAISHTIRQSVTEVVASAVPTSNYCRMFWKADGPGMQTRILPRISHYLGIGGEIAVVAMREGVDNVHWYSGSKMPLVDLRWNMEQYYAPICQYIHVPREQTELDARFQFHESLWQAEEVRDAFVIVEDEFCNAFEMSRTFAARIVHKGFVNVLSENYMLRDYMCANEELFTNDPKAIPSIVPDYARTERNFVLRTLMLMATTPVDESTLSRELSLHGCDTRDPYQKFCSLIQKHTCVEDPQIQTVRDSVWVGSSQFSRFAYSADRSFVESIFDSALKLAYYVVENEQPDTYPMGNRLMGHVEQVMLPGQFFCYGGKYYQVRSISATNGIIVRRAADHLNGRVYYRQLRSYKMDIDEWSDNARNLRSMTLQSCYVNYVVRTDGYLEMKARNLLSDATVIYLDSVRSRQIIHKETLKVQMPEATPEIRFTLCVLLNELFQTIYPNESEYLVAAANGLPVAVAKNADYAARIRALVPAVSAPPSEEDSIFFIEDSSIDLGLLISVERNFQRLMEILADYLDWYLDPKRVETELTVHSDSETHGTGERGPRTADKSDVDGEDEELIDESVRIGSAWMKRIEYLTYGYGEVPEWLALQETLEYMNEHAFHDSNLHRSRKMPHSFDDGSSYDPNQPGTHYCDFCGRVLEEGKYDVLKDGRERCVECGKDAVKTGKQFKQLYVETLDEMERTFGIQIDVPVTVRMANAKKVNDIPGYRFAPSPRFDCRILGYAQKTKNGYKLIVENGAPRWKMKSTIVHELTHIWQFSHWMDEQIKKAYPDQETREVVSEGMAVWTEIQYLLSMGEEERAIIYKRNRDSDSSVYGVGMKKYLEKYPPKNRVAVDLKKSPFGRFPPL